MAKQYYFENEDAEICYQADYFLHDMKLEGISEKEVLEAIPTKDPDHFWCSYYGAVGERGDCGRICKEYSPKNGKNGCCKHVGRMFLHGEKVTLKLNDIS